MFDFSGDEAMFMMIAEVAGVGEYSAGSVVVLSHAPPVNPVRSGLSLRRVCLDRGRDHLELGRSCSGPGHIDYLILFLAGAARGSH
jgi:hypothetical protein